VTSRAVRANAAEDAAGNRGCRFAGLDWAGRCGGCRAGPIRSVRFWMWSRWRSICCPRVGHAHRVLGHLPDAKLVPPATRAMADRAPGRTELGDLHMDPESGHAQKTVARRQRTETPAHPVVEPGAGIITGVAYPGVRGGARRSRGRTRDARPAVVDLPPGTRSATASPSPTPLMPTCTEGPRRGWACRRIVFLTVASACGAAVRQPAQRVACPTW
jgi:hypothetical protein